MSLHVHVYVSSSVGYGMQSIVLWKYICKLINSNLLSRVPHYFVLISDSWNTTSPLWRIYTSTYCRICLWTILNQKIVLHVFWYCHNKVDRMVHLQPIGNRSVHYYNISFEDYYQSVARTFLITHKGQNVFGWWCYPKPWGAKVIIDLNGHYCSTVVS